MADENLADALFGTPEQAPEPAPVEAPAPAPEQQAPAPEQAASPVIEEPQPAPGQKPDHFVPLPKYLDTRDELKEAKRKLAEFEARQQQAPQQAPDPIDDPNGYAAFHEQRMEQALTAQKFQMSDVMAKQAHGAETVETAMSWAVERAQSDPVFAAQYMREAHPIDWIVRQHRQDGLMKQIGEDPDAYVRRRAAELGLIASQPAPAPMPAGMTQPAPVQQTAPTRSLVDLPSGGGVTSVPMGPTAGFDAVFTR